MESSKLDVAPGCLSSGHGLRDSLLRFATRLLYDRIEEMEVLSLVLKR